jgi:hypothetical protein
VGPRAGLDTEAKGKILCPCRGSNPDRPVVQKLSSACSCVITHCAEVNSPHDVVVSVLATGPRVRGFESVQGD